ncbi:MAG: sigma-70 family RNA polymerase sigma factor [Candidatus Eisenbacteria bacterium]|nr:sigma-70 family RNA polymerase sigma factor [Candidatus Latescibacterota bacterium]MBD3301933.1 sigma-70 family RNA polymerase sigma factor [Candidatus Eisenbacteria bacterium]
MNPFRADDDDIPDAELVRAAQNGNRSALEVLIRRHQAWIYNTALRMVFTPEVAEDITQDVLIKMLTRLSSFAGRSAFRTWLYRILYNHVLDLKRTGSEKLCVSFANYDRMLDELPDGELLPTRFGATDAPLIAEEVRISCLMGMLICLNRDQRFAFVIGGIWQTNDRTGGEIMGISRESFRQKLSRARRCLRSFLDDRCSLVSDCNRCRCKRKAKALIDAGYLDPNELTFGGGSLRKVRDVVRERTAQIDDLVTSHCDALFADTPFMDPPDYSAVLRSLLRTDELRELYDLN